MADSNKTGLVALRDRREQTIERLTAGFTDGALEIEEFELRVERAHDATSLVALDDLVRDLEPATADGALVVRPQTAGSLDTSRSKKNRVVALMGGAERTGVWQVPATLNVTTVMGGVYLDFREAVLPPGVTDVNVFSMMGGVDIIVPPHVAVELGGIAFMGAFGSGHRALTERDAQTPVLRISGVALMGAVEIETRLKGESRRAATQRRRQQRKQRRRLPVRERTAHE